MRAGREPLFTQALPQPTVDQRPACSVAVARDRRVFSWLIAVTWVLFAALYVVGGYTDSGRRHEIPGGVAGFVKVASVADDYDLLDDARREEPTGNANTPHAAPVYSSIQSEDGDLLDDARREETRGAQNSTRI